MTDKLSTYDRLAISTIAAAMLLFGAGGSACALPPDEPPPMVDWLGRNWRQVNAQRDLYKAMQEVSDAVSDFIRKSGRCPDSGDGVEPLMEELKRLSLVNPYASGEDSAVPIRVHFDEGLSEPMVHTFKEKPPASWKAPTGTITVLLSHSNELFVVWGASIENTPIRHPESGKILLIARPCR